MSHRQLTAAEQDLYTVNCHWISFLSISKVGIITFNI